jgi:putative glutamine amidotransferase
MAMIPAFYIEGITRAGGLAIMLPPQQLSSAEAKDIITSLDGLMLCGGRDIDSARYGQNPHGEAEQPDKLRDDLEEKLLSAAIDADLPFLGICRGAQMLNINRGGTLIQHLPDVVGHNRYQLGNAKFTAADVEVETSSILGSLVGEKISNAALYHHQAIDELGKGLKITAKTEDGIVEAVELADHPFGVAVQWHPEQTLDDLRIFEGLIEAARKYRGTK